jgi:hypothetical protein
VGGDQHRHALELELAHPRKHLAHQLRIQRARDLVEQEDPGLGDERG